MKLYIYTYLIILIGLFVQCDTAKPNNPNAEVEKSILEKENHIQLPHDQFLKLERKKRKASELGVVISGEDDYVRGEIIIDNNQYAIEIKLISNKNHIEYTGENSYRVKIKNGNFNGVRVLNLTPLHSKIDLVNWITHQICKDNDILSPRTGMIQIKINDSETKAYVWDEHFEKQLLESQNRREAPIVKFDVKPLKELIIKQKASGNKYEVDIFNATAILPFNQKKTLSSEILKEQFLQAASLLDQLKNNPKEIKDLIDIEKLALLYYIKTQLLVSDYSTEWQNLRYYYNPTNAKLEPIFYSGYTPSELTSEQSKEFETSLFNNSDFIKYYNSIPEGIIQNIHDNSTSEEFTKISDFFDRNKRTIESKKDSIDNLILSEMYEPLESLSLASYNQNGEIHLTNLHSKTLEILGTGNESTILTKFKKFIKPKSIEKIKTEDAYIYYRVKNRITTYKTSTSNRVKIPSISIGQKVRSLAKVPKGFTIQSDTLIFSANSITYTKDVIIPAGYKVLVPSGSNLIFKNCGFQSFSTVFFEGNSEANINIKGENASGFSVIDTKQISSISYTNFIGFENSKHKGWELPGAVTFNNSDVKIDHVTISDNNCEDALNIVNSSFEISQLEISNTFGDGFDADFCEGTLSDSKFENIGNDGVDFSNCSVVMADCSINKCGDKGISAGENSNLKITNTDLKNCFIGVASKDLSSVDMNQSSIRFCNRNFTVFQKKKEYGPATIICKDNTIELGKNENLIDFNSSLTLRKIKYKGEIKLNIDSLYQK